MSDLGEVGQKQLLESDADLTADVVIAGMPEQGEPLQDQILRAIGPRVIVLGTSRYPYYAAGTPELRQRLEASGAKVFYTTEADAVTIRLSPDQCELSGMNGAKIELKRSVRENRND